MALRGMPSYSRDFGFLGHDHAALALDRPHAQGAVAAGAGEHDADRPLALVLRQRAEEEVDRQALAARRRGLEQVQLAVQEGHVAVGRNDVGAVRPHHHAVLDLEDLHAGVALDQIGEDALVVGREVLHQHEGHAGIRVGRDGGEERLEGRQTAGRGADADDGEGRLGRWLGNRFGRWLGNRFGRWVGNCFGRWLGGRFRRWLRGGIRIGHARRRGVRGRVRPLGRCDGWLLARFLERADGWIRGNGGLTWGLLSVHNLISENGRGSIMQDRASDCSAPTPLPPRRRRKAPFSSLCNQSSMQKRSV